MPHIGACLLCLAVVLSAGACGSGDDVDEEGRDRCEAEYGVGECVQRNKRWVALARATSTIATAVTTTTTTPPPEAGKEPSEVPKVNTGEIHFQTPSGNIGCLVTDDWAECDIRDSTFAPPPRPDDCPVDWGSSISVAADGAGFVCKGDTVRVPDERKLAYGESVRTAFVECFSREDGVTCTHRRTGRGFQLAKARYRLF